MKKSDIKNLIFLTLFHGLSFEILEKKIGCTRLIIFQEGKVGAVKLV